MNGIILSENNYTYEGTIINNEAHGKGTYLYKNGDKYIGECKYGKPDGFGKYLYKSGSMYLGYFSYGKIHGVGTYEDTNNISKGSWRSDKKHGLFYKTKKDLCKTFMQKWNRGKLIISEEVQYIQPSALITTKQNPKNIPKKYQITYKGVDKKCMACCDKPTNAINDVCGHVTMCYECLCRCDKCPICRAPIRKIIRLFIS